MKWSIASVFASLGLYSGVLFVDGDKCPQQDMLSWLGVVFIEAADLVVMTEMG